MEGRKELVVICPEGDTVEGIDVSHHQGTIDWDAVAASDVEWAIIRVSHGTAVMDREFARNWEEAGRVGLIRGVYQFFSASADPIEQADLVIDSIGGELQVGELPPVLDIESLSVESYPAATVIANMRTWVARIEDRLGVAPIIYTAKYFWRDQLGDPDFSAYPLWVANYGVDCPDAPSAWTDWTMWQYTSDGSVPGIAGRVDRNLFNGSISDLMAFVGIAPECGDGWCSGGETHDTCPIDCEICASIPPLGRDVDETELCFEQGGSPSYWNLTSSVGWAGSLLWTHATDATVPDNYGIWKLTFDDAGRYRVEAYTAAGYAHSKQANYRVRHAGVEDSFLIDQSGVDGWAEIGEVEFAAGGDQWVRLDDNTGEPFDTRTRIAFDAIRLTRLDPPTDPEPSRDAGTLPVDAGVDGGGMVVSGCGCRTVGTYRGSASAVVLLGLLPAAALRRRRRRN